MLPFCGFFSSIFFVPKTVSGIMMGQIVILYNTIRYCVVSLLYCIDSSYSIQYITVHFPDIVF